MGSTSMVPIVLSIRVSDDIDSLMWMNANAVAELSDWLVNAFNGEFLRMEQPKPVGFID